MELEHPNEIYACCVSWKHPGVDQKINKIDLAAYHMKLALVAPHEWPLSALSFE